MPSSITFARTSLLGATLCGRPNRPRLSSAPGRPHGADPKRPALSEAERGYDYLPPEVGHTRPPLRNHGHLDLPDEKKMSHISSCESGGFCEKNITDQSAKWTRSDELTAELAETAENGWNQELSATSTLSAVKQNLILM